VESGKVKMPSAPRMGILDFIKNFIGNVLLGYFAVRLIKHLPKIMPIVKFLGNAADFIINTGGELLNGLITFAQKGQEAHDKTRGFLKSFGGENFAKGFDKFIGAIDTALFLTTVLAGSMAMEAMSGGGGGGLMKDTVKGEARKSAGVFGRGATRAVTRLGLKTIGKGGTKAILGAVRPLVRNAPLIGGLLEFGISWALGDPLPKAAFRGVGTALLAAVGAAIGGPIGLAIGGYAGGELGGVLYDMFFNNKKPSQKSKVQGRAGGGVTRGGRSRGRVKRTLSKQKYKRVLAPQKPSKTEFKDKEVKKSTEELDKTKYFGPILAVSSKIMNKEEPTQRDYQNVGLGINLLIAKGIQDGQLKGGIVAKFAGGGLVDPDVLSAAETGGDISNWVAKTFRGAIETGAQRTMRLMKEMREMEKRKKEKDEGAGGATGDFTPGSVPGGQLTMEQLVGLAKGAGFPTNEAVIMAAIAKGESGGNSNAKNFKPPDKSYGLWQINMIGNLGPARMQEFGLQREDQLFDPVTNAKAAYAIRKSQGLSAWTIYKNGAYKNHLSAAEAVKNAPSLRTSPSFGSMELGKGYGTEGSKIAGELGRFMKKKGVVPGSVHRHPEHPPYSLSSGHSRNSLHYQGRAIDLGAYANEQGPVLAAVAEFNKLKGVKPVQLYHGGNDPDHADHVHVAYALGGRVPKLTFAMLGERGPEFVFDADTTAGLDRLAPQLLEKLNIAKTKPQLASILQSYAPYDASASSQTIVIQSSSAPSGGRNNNSSGGGVAVIPIPVDNFTEILAMIG
jgi:hypothetical protein